MHILKRGAEKKQQQLKFLLPTNEMEEGFLS